jgi:hypothetical protein
MELKLVVAAAVKELIEGECHSHRWMTTDALLHHLEVRYGFNKTDNGASLLTVNTKLLKTVVKNAFPGSGLLQDGVVANGVFTISRYTKSGQVSLYYLCRPGTVVVLCRGGIVVLKQST